MLRSLVAALCFVVSCAGWLAGGAPATAAESGFAFQDAPGKYLDVLLDGRTALRYMYEAPVAERRDETYKPYLHVFDAEGKEPITKGPGGVFPHHRGIFIGWRKIAFNGKSYDRWHMLKGEIIHRKFTEQQADAQHATFTSQTEWTAEPGHALLEELRTTTVRRAPAPGRLVIDFVSQLKAVAGDVTLDGDPEHAGVQYRPAKELDTTKTVYTYPKEKADAHHDLDYPWVGESYTLAGKEYSVVHMNHPGNPKGTRYSAYRDYGRFGAFATSNIKSGDTLTLRYRFLVVDGPMPDAAAIQTCWDEFAGVAQPSPVPKTSVVPAEKSKPAAKKPAEKKGGKKAEAKKGTAQGSGGDNPAAGK